MDENKEPIEQTEQPAQQNSSALVKFCMGFDAVIVLVIISFLIVKLPEINEDVPVSEVAEAELLSYDTIMIFEGTPIPVGDFQFFFTMLGMEPGEEARQTSIQNLLSTLVIIDRAKRHGFEPTEEEMQKHLEDARELREYMLSTTDDNAEFISDQRIAEINAAWQSPLDMLMDEYLFDYVPDEGEIAAFIDVYMDSIVMNATASYYKYVSSLDHNEILTAQQSFANGEADFDTLIRNGSSYTEGDETVVIDLWTLFEMVDASFEDYEMLISLEEGGISDIVQNEDGVYFIVYLSETIIDQAIIDDSIIYHRQYFIESQRVNIFWEMIDQWREEANYTVNEHVLNLF